MSRRSAPHRTTFLQIEIYGNSSIIAQAAIMDAINIKTGCLARPKPG